MSLKQFYNSIQSIIKNKHISRAEGIIKHLKWQFRKSLNLFPFIQQISQSIIIAKHRRCGVSALINSQGLYNYHNMNLIKRLLKAGGIFFDVGANIGSYSLIASEQEKGLVYSFEPHPITFQMLQENIKINRRQNVKLFNMALGTMTGKVSFSDDPGSATNCIAQGEGQKNIQVDCFRGDSFCKEHQVYPTFMKIDVEGFEYNVLSGFGDLLREIDLLLIEINGLSNLRSKGEREVLNLLTKNEFKGPLFFNHDFLTFSNQANGEDSIFLSARFLKNTEFIIDANLTKR